MHLSIHLNIYVTTQIENHFVQFGKHIYLFVGDQPTWKFEVYVWSPGVLHKKNTSVQQEMLESLQNWPHLVMRFSNISCENLTVSNDSPEYNQVGFWLGAPKHDMFMECRNVGILARKAWNTGSNSIIEPRGCSSNQNPFKA